MSNMSVTKIKLWYWLVERLPKTLIYFCFMHVMAHSTTGKYGNTYPNSLGGMDAIKRYSDDHNI